MPPPEVIHRIAPAVWEIAPTWRPGMRVPIRIFATPELVQAMDDAVFEQAAHVAALPGIVGASMVMPDAHWGYGSIGGVVAMDPATGVISPGGIGLTSTAECASS
jgi:tRNA-splicing ligase RtcB